MSMKAHSILNTDRPVFIAKLLQLSDHNAPSTVLYDCSLSVLNGEVHSQ